MLLSTRDQFIASYILANGIDLCTYVRKNRWRVQQKLNRVQAINFVKWISEAEALDFTSKWACVPLKLLSLTLCLDIFFGNTPCSYGFYQLLLLISNNFFLCFWYLQNIFFFFLWLLGFFFLWLLGFLFYSKIWPFIFVQILGKCKNQPFGALLLWPINLFEDRRWDNGIVPL